MVKQTTCAECGKKGAVLFQRQDVKLPLCKNLSCIPKNWKSYYTKVKKDSAKIESGGNKNDMAIKA